MAKHVTARQRKRHRWFTLKDVALELEVSEGCLRREIKIGNLEHTKFGANYRFKREWIDAYTMKKAGSGTTQEVEPCQS